MDIAQKKAAQETSLEEFIRLAEESKAHMQEELSKLNLQRSQSSIYLIALYMRASEIFNGIIALAKGRVPVCGFILNRTLCECFAYVKASVKDPEFHRTAFNKHLNEKRKRAVNIRRDLSKLSIKIDEVELDGIETYNRDAIDPNFKILADNYQLFASNGLQDLYHQVFAHCSLFTHNDSHTLDRYVDPNGIDIAPSDHFVSDSILNLAMATKIYFELYRELLSATGSQSDYAMEFAAQYNAVQDRASKALAGEGSRV